MSNRRGSGKGGRKPRPVALKIASGMRADRIPSNSIDAPQGTPEAPSYLDEFGKEGWLRISSAAARLGISSPVDADAMAVYATAYSRWRWAQEALKGGKLTILTARGETTNPAAGLAERSERTMLSVLSLFGLNPSDRGRLRASDQGEIDEFEAWNRERGKA